MGRGGYECEGDVTMATSTTTYVNGTYKTTDENGRVTYSDSPPTAPSAPQGGQQSDAGDTPVKSNDTKGMIYADIVTDRITGKPVEIKRDANGKITPESQKELDKVQEARSKKILANNRKIQEARDKVNAEKAAEAANENKLIGGTLELNVTLPDGTNLIDKKVEAGHVKTDSSVSTSVGLDGKIKKKAGIEDVPTPGISVSGGLVISAKGLKTFGASPKQVETLQTIDKTKEELNEDIKKAKENRDKKLAEFKPQEANDQFMKDIADMTRKWGSKAVEAALK